MFPGCCCIANRHIGARERRQLIPHVRFQVPFLGPESQLKSGFACAGRSFSQSVALIFIGILMIDKAAVHLMATSITQLTLCQVSSEEIETETATTVQ